MMWLETVDVNLADAVFAQVELSQLPQFFKVLDFDDFVVSCVKDF